MNPLLIASVVLGIVAVALAGFGVWSYVNYLDQKNNTDAKIETAVSAAKTEQKTELEKDFLEREKQPYAQLVGPDDLGHVTFNYPKTWSVYIAENSGTAFSAYLHPVSVPMIATTQPYAARVGIVDRPYDDVLQTYDSAIKKGVLKSSPITINGFTGTRFDGEFSKERQGSTVLFKVRDKTLALSTDATTFKQDFDEIILKTLDFNP